MLRRLAAVSPSLASAVSLLSLRHCATAAASDGNARRETFSAAKMSNRRAQQRKRKLDSTVLHYGDAIRADEEVKSLMSRMFSQGEGRTKKGPFNLYRSAFLFARNQPSWATLDEKSRMDVVQALVVRKRPSELGDDLPEAFTQEGKRVQTLVKNHLYRRGHTFVAVYTAEERQRVVLEALAAVRNRIAEKAKEFLALGEAKTLPDATKKAEDFAHATAEINANQKNKNNKEAVVKKTPEERRNSRRQRRLKAKELRRAASDSLASAVATNFCIRRTGIEGWRKLSSHTRAAAVDEELTKRVAKMSFNDLHTAYYGKKGKRVGADAQVDRWQPKEKPEGVSTGLFTRVLRELKRKNALGYKASLPKDKKMELFTQLVEVHRRRKMEGAATEGAKKQQ